MLKYKEWNIEAITGYKPKTTFYMDFSIADSFGNSAIKETYDRVKKEWGKDIVYVTEFYMVLNWKIWEHHESDPSKAELYQSLYEELETFIYDSYGEDDLTYFLETTD